MNEHGLSRVNCFLPIFTYITLLFFFLNDRDPLERIGIPLVET